LSDAYPLPSHRPAPNRLAKPCALRYNGPEEQTVTLEMSKVTRQIEDMGRVLAERASRQSRAVPAARALLREFADRQPELRLVAESEAGQRLRCATPGDESLNLARPARSMPEPATLVAADGSQIFPDRHGPAFYYVINVGSIVFRHGSGQAPQVATTPRLYYAEKEVFPSGNPISGDLISARRDLAEMCILAEQTLAEPANGPPRLALADGPLLIWLQRAAIPEEEQTRILHDYLACLSRLRAGGAAVAGFVSRPRSAEVIALLYLAHLPEEERQAVKGLDDTDFRGLTDRTLFGYLRPGERSALFVRGTATNRDFGAQGHTIFFFYLNTGTDLARIEIPEWTARNTKHLDLVHAAVYDQCRFNNGYPYILTRADEQAVILGEERQLLEDMIRHAMLRHGLAMPESSPKAQQKEVARWRRRRT